MPMEKLAELVALTSLIRLRLSRRFCEITMVDEGGPGPPEVDFLPPHPLSDELAPGWGVGWSRPGHDTPGLT
jgi:hypothetical protein